MLDARKIRANPEEVKKQLEKRNLSRVLRPYNNFNPKIV